MFMASFSTLVKKQLFHEFLSNHSIDTGNKSKRIKLSGGGKCAQKRQRVLKSAKIVWKLKNYNLDSQIKPRIR